MPHVYVEGIGLSNVRERLRVLYGADFNLDITSHEGQGTKIRIDVPQLVPVIPEVSVFWPSFLSPGGATELSPATTCPPSPLTNALHDCMFCQD